MNLEISIFYIFVELTLDAYFKILLINLRTDLLGALNAEIGGFYYKCVFFFSIQLSTFIFLAYFQVHCQVLLHHPNGLLASLSAGTILSESQEGTIF